MRLAILGAGAWGTALAIHAAARHSVTLWGRDPDCIAQIERFRENRRYLPGYPLPSSLALEQDLQQACAAGQDLVIVATSMSGLRAVTAAMGPGQAPIVWLSKGLEAGTALLPHQVVSQTRPERLAGVLSGPSFAQEVAQGLPVALVVASPHESVGVCAVAALHHGAMRLYRSSDWIGVEVAAAVKNIMAIATGVADGLGLGLNARAALLTRGLAEMARYGIALGARPDTFLGLAGMGDLVLTCTGDLSRNRQVGLQLAAGKSLPAVLDSLGHVAEGVACCQAVLASARDLGVEMPLTRAVAQVLFEGRAPVDVLQDLLSREPRAEGG